MNHQRKLISITAFLLLCLCSKIFAIGAGVQIGGNPGLLITSESEKLERFTGTVIGTMRFSRIPVAVGFGLETGKNFSDFAFGFEGFSDYYALDFQLDNTWNLYSGFGATGSLLLNNSSHWTLSAGARFFAGLNWLFWDNYLEVYVQQNLVPTFVKELSNSDSDGQFMLCLPFEAGVRMHF